MDSNKSIKEIKIFQVGMEFYLLVAVLLRYKTETNILNYFE
jgi:hypothetical protein